MRSSHHIGEESLAQAVRTVFRRDFYRYDEQAETIECVGLVKARRGRLNRSTGVLTISDVFVDDVTQVLIICTASRLTLLGLSRPSARELNLYHTNLSIDTPTAMLSMVGNSSGRVFLRGGNKDLYELVYSNESRWFFGNGARVNITNRSGSAASTWIPTIFGSDGESNLQEATYV